jgi:hypothetical protein
MERHKALLAAYESMKTRLNAGFSFSDFEKQTFDWQVEPVSVDGELAGAVLINGPEIHACILPDYFGRWLTRSVLRRTLYAVLEKYGYATTHVTEGNAIGDAFVKRLGFVEVAPGEYRKTAWEWKHL